ncbi:MAG: SH3 domain-containing protein [Parasphingorhabdus sp.]|uniref:SH3 domain-containing protein n=1 Tax=Parasphingorhabdus sp. TaxID=2709688 RepID=UPI003263E380
MLNRFTGLVAAVILCGANVAVAPVSAGSKHRPIELVQCKDTLGTIAVIEGEARSWVDKNLGSPKAIIEALINQSGCFTLYDPNSAQAANYLLTVVAGDRFEVAKATNLNSAGFANAAALAQNSSYRSGMGTAGDIAGVVPLAGAVVNGLAGMVGIGKKNTVVTGLTLIATSQNSAIAAGTGLVQKTKLKFHDDEDDAMAQMPEGYWMRGVETASAELRYTKKESGREMVQSFVIAYNNMVRQARALGVGQKLDEQIEETSTVEEEPTPVLAAADSFLYLEPSREAETIRAIRPGVALIPIGELDGIFLPVKDAYGVLGWVSVEDLQ